VPRVVRRRRLPATAQEIWSVISDPYHLPRWWPRTQRVENVSGGDGKGRRWTQVLETRDGRGVRADYRCTSAASGERYIFEQQLADSPFERILKSATTEIRLDPSDGDTEVTLASEQRLRGIQRFGGGLFLRRATGRTLAAALEGLDRAVGGAAAEARD
jgi:uncharacterized protein YndB with AHSA1/START domain